MPSAGSSSRADVEAYYRAVAPFYDAEMALRGDVPEWVGLARRAGAKVVLDVGAGGGRIGAALRDDDPSRRVVAIDLTAALLLRRPRTHFVLGDMRALPLAGGRADLACAANDPLAHLLDDADRTRAVTEMRRALAPGGRAVIDGLWLPAPDREAARTELIRERSLGRLTIHERWHGIGGDVYDTMYEYRRPGADPVRARARVRAWRPGEPALRDALIAGDLAGGPFDPARPRIVISFGPHR